MFIVVSLLNSLTENYRFGVLIQCAAGWIPSWDTEKGSRDNGDGGKNEDPRGTASGTFQFGFSVTIYC